MSKQKHMLPFEIFQKISQFVFILVVFKKNSSHLFFSFFESIFWLQLLEMTITNQQCQKSHLPLFSGKKNLVRRNVFVEKLLFEVLHQNRGQWQTLD